MLWNLAAPRIKEGGGEERVETGKLVDHIDMEQLTMGTPLPTPLSQDTLLQLGVYFLEKYSDLSYLKNFILSELHLWF